MPGKKVKPTSQPTPTPEETPLPIRPAVQTPAGTFSQSGSSAAESPTSTLPTSPSPASLPKDPDDPNRKHIEGKCWCGLIHPPHLPSEMDCNNAPVCWCGEKHCGIGIRRK